MDYINFNVLQKNKVYIGILFLLLFLGGYKLHFLNSTLLLRLNYLVPTFIRVTIIFLLFTFFRTIKLCLMHDN